MGGEKKPKNLSFFPSCSLGDFPREVQSYNLPGCPCKKRGGGRKEGETVLEVSGKRREKYVSLLKRRRRRKRKRRSCWPTSSLYVHIKVLLYFGLTHHLLLAPALCPRKPRTGRRGGGASRIDPFFFYLFDEVSPPNLRPPFDHLTKKAEKDLPITDFFPSHFPASDWFLKKMLLSKSCACPVLCFVFRATRYIPNLVQLPPFCSLSLSLSHLCGWVSLPPYPPSLPFPVHQKDSSIGGGARSQILPKMKKDCRSSIKEGKKS